VIFYKKLLNILLIISIAFFCPLFAHANKDRSIKYVERSFEEELILAVQLNYYTLNEGILAYQHQTGVLLPLSDMVNSLGFAIEVNTSTGIAEGWFLDKKRRFFLDAVKGELNIEGKKRKYPKQLVEIHDFDIYVDAKVFSDWFPVIAEASLPVSAVKIKSQEPLPIEQKIARQKIQNQLSSYNNFYEEQKLPNLVSPYSLIDISRADITITGDINKNDNSSNYNASYNTYLAGDLLYMTSNIFASGQDANSLNNLRVSLERKDNDSNLTPLNLTEVKIGDVFGPNIPLMTRGGSGRGVYVSNFPLESVREFDRITLRGDLPVGWEVELYRNDSLLNVVSTPDSNGRYEFTNVQLLVGQNILKLVFYGPQGQRREEIKSYNIGGGAIQPGKQYFSFLLSQHEKDLFDGINRAQNNSADDEDIGKYRGILEYNMGITNRISLVSSFATVPIEGERKNLLRTGFLTTFLGTFTGINYISAFDGTGAIELNSQFNAKGINVNISHEHYISDFVSEETFDLNDPFTDVTSLSFNGSLSTFDNWIPRVSYGLDAEHTTRKSGLAELELRGRFSSNVGGVSLTNNITSIEILNSNDNVDRDIFGDFLISTSNFMDIPRFSIRGNTNYTISPETNVNNVSVTTDYGLNDDTGLRFGVAKQFNESDSTSFNAGFNKNFNKYALSMNSQYDTDGNFNMGVSVSLSVDFSDSKNKSYMPKFYREKYAGNGTVTSKIFLDNNNNETFDSGDEPIEGAKINFGRRVSEEETDNKGLIRVGGLRAYNPVNISLNRDSLNDPYMISPNKGNNIVPRPGKTVNIDFPVYISGEIDGTVFLKLEGELKEISDVKVQLINNKNEVVDEQVTVFDGFYLFSNVLPGKYTLKIHDKVLKKYNLSYSGAKTIVIDNDGTTSLGNDFYLIKE